MQLIPGSQLVLFEPADTTSIQMLWMCILIVHPNKQVLFSASIIEELKLAKHDILNISISFSYAFKESSDNIISCPR